MDDLDRLWTWFADREVVRYSHSMWQFPFSRSETQEWLERTLRDKQTLTLAMVERSSDRFIGFAGIADLRASIAAASTSSSSARKIVGQKAMERRPRS